MAGKTTDELLLSCLSVESNGRKAQTLSQISGVEWKAVVQQSVRHDVAALLCHRLTTEEPGGAIPASVLQTLRAMMLQVAVGNLHLYRDLTQILNAFQEEIIPVLVLKGAYLAEIVYGNRALRPMGDLDLLVRKTDLSRAEAVLRRMHYGGLWQPSVDAPHRHSRPLLKVNGVKIDLHWALERPTAPFAIDVEGLWRRAQPATIAGVEVLVLSPEDLLLHLCLHTSFDHQFRFGLRALCDITETLRHHQHRLDWGQVHSRTRQWGIGKSVYLTLHLAREYVGAAVPEEILDSFRPAGFDPRVLVWASTQVFSGRSADPSLPPGLAQLWEHKNLLSKTLFFWKRVCPPPKTMAELYSLSPASKRVYLCYPVRWQKLLLQHGRATWKLLRRDEALTDLAEQENQRLALKNWLAAV